MITDEQIADGCNKAYLKAGHNAYFGNGFEAGVKFAEQQFKILNIPVVMPRSLTAENGAKALLMGEFFEEHECSYYNGDGELVEYTEKVPVSWGTIKEIYAKIVAHYGA
jgi:hypothetical protein